MLSVAEIQPGLELPRTTHRPDLVDLFRYSAVLWLAHLIHYDEQFARADGHAGAVVHGPLQGAFLAGLVEQWAAAHGGRVIEMSYRHWQTAHAGDALVAQGRVASVERAAAVTRVCCEVALVREADGAVTTSGRIDVEIPAP